MRVIVWARFAFGFHVFFYLTKAPRHLFGLESPVPRSPELDELGLV
jgi:hypothetical protein